MGTIIEFPVHLRARGDVLTERARAEEGQIVILPVVRYCRDYVPVVRSGSLMEYTDAEAGARQRIYCPV